MSTRKSIAVFSHQGSKILLVLGSIWLAGCSSTAVDVQQQLSDTYLGRNIDEIVARFGPAKTAFKMNTGVTSYLWELDAVTDINTDKGSGDAQTLYCRLKIMASSGGIVFDVSTEDSTNASGESLCAKKLGVRRST
jgi:hypothetical protein